MMLAVPGFVERMGTTIKNYRLYVLAIALCLSQGCSNGGKYSYEKFVNDERYVIFQMYANSISLENMKQTVSENDLKSYYMDLIETHNALYLQEERNWEQIYELRICLIQMEKLVKIYGIQILYT